MSNDRNEGRNNEAEALRFISHTLNSMNEIMICTNDLLFECIGVSEELRGGLVYKDHPHVGVMYDSLLEVMTSVWNHYAYPKYAISTSKLKVDIFKDRDLTVPAGTIMYKIHDTSSGMGSAEDEGSVDTEDSDNNEEANDEE